MGKKIKRPNANPILALLLTWFVFGLGHVIVNGQTNKWLMIMVTSLIGSCLCLPGILVGILGVVDAYQTAVRLQKGEAIRENEYSNELLYKICKIIDKKATFKNAK